MVHCELFEKMAPLYIYGDLKGAELAAYRNHLEACEVCSSGCHAMAETLKLMDKRVLQVPSEAFFESFEQKLMAEIQIQDQKAAKKGQWLWIGQGLLAAALLVTAILLGPTIFTPNGNQGVVSLIQDTPQASFSSQANHYVTRSKTLLIGLVNMELESNTSPNLDLSLHRTMSRQLVSEASYLRENYPQQAKGRLLELINELEVIFLQIAHLESKGSIEGLQLIRDGVSNSDLLLKINLEQLQPSLQPASSRDAAL